MQDIVTVISNLGFPIACCVFLGWYCKYTVDRLFSSVNEIIGRYDNLVKSQQDVVANNTAALTELSGRLHELAVKMGEDDHG